MRAVALDIHEEDFSSPIPQDNVASLAALNAGAKLYIDLRCTPNEYLDGYDWGEAFCTRPMCREMRGIQFFARTPEHISQFFEDLQPLLIALRTIVEKGIRLYVTFKNQL